MLEEAASILAHHQTEKQAEESGNFLFSSSLSSAGLRQRRPMNNLSTATAVEGSSVSASGGGGTSSRAKNPLPPPKASTLVGITNSSGNLTDGSNFSSAPNRAEDQKMKRSSLVILDSTVETPGEGVVDANSSNYQRCWVLIFGVTSSVFTTVLYPKLESFGTIERHIISSSNWMAIQYSTELQAEKACCQNGSTLILEDGNILLIGVLRCTPQLYNQLRLPSYLSSSNRSGIGSSTKDQLPSSTLASTPAISSSRLPSTTNGQQQSSNQNEDEDIFLHSTSVPTADNKSKGIIGSILGWFFMW
jgi:hypothetical protein